MITRLGSVLAWLEVMSHRRLLYRIAAVAGPLLITAGFLTSGQLAADTTILGGLLGLGGNGLAVRHSLRDPFHEGNGRRSRRR